MEFRLIYQGPLRANGSPTDKQGVRRAFHPQLQELWNQLPLRELAQPPKNFLNPNPSPSQISLVHPTGSFQFVPLVSECLNLVAQLEIVLLRPEQPGSIVTRGGDIDNRLKTLLDALRMPKTASELPPGDTPQAGETLFFCLLEDDALVTGISIITDRLLDPSCDPAEVRLLIHVRVRGTRVSYNNLGIIG